jgi:hypothetical protein
VHNQKLSVVFRSLYCHHEIKELQRFLTEISIGTTTLGSPGSEVSSDAVGSNSRQAALIVESNTAFAALTPTEFKDAYSAALIFSLDRRR